jgi:hypothetical protein
MQTQLTSVHCLVLPLPPVNAMPRVVALRCKVRAYESASHTFSLLNQDGSLPSRQYVQMACQVSNMLPSRQYVQMACQVSKTRRQCGTHSVASDRACRNTLPVYMLQSTNGSARSCAYVRVHLSTPCQYALSSCCRSCCHPPLLNACAYCY